MNSSTTRKKNPRCRNFEGGYCQYGDRCRYLHELPPKKRKNKSRKSKQNQLENNSRGKICGICFEEVMAKKKGTDKFGILPNCKHCFCFPCIKRWRKSIHFEDEVTKGCPECRVNSNHVYKNSYWVDDDYKEKFIASRNEKLITIDCKYFNGGMGMCREGNECLFKHVLNLEMNPSGRPRAPQDDSCNLIITVRMVNNQLHFSYLGDSTSDENVDDEGSYENLQIV